MYVDHIDEGKLYKKGEKCESAHCSEQCTQTAVTREMYKKEGKQNVKAPAAALAAACIIPTPAAVMLSTPTRHALSS
jgi:hypothetical protein